MQSPWLKWFPCGFHGFYSFYTVSMVCFSNWAAFHVRQWAFCPTNIVIHSTFRDTQASKSKNKNKNNRTARKSAQRVHQFSCSMWFSSCWKLGMCHMFISWWCLLAPHFHWDLWKYLFYCSGSSKMHVGHPQKKLRFLEGFAFRHTASDSFPSLQLADRLCSDITHISISMYVSPLPWSVTCVFTEMCSPN